MKEIIEKFYVRGFHAGTLRKTPASERMVALLTDMRQGPLREGFQWIQKEKYRGSKDLRPYAHEYDDIFMDFLFDQDIPGLVRELTGMELTLLHAKLRINLPGEPYSTWHRDTDFYRGRTKGMVPPAINVHFYPCLGAEPEPQLKVWPGTHRLIMPYKILDRCMVKLKKGEEIHSSDTRFTVLDTGLIHQITRVSDPGGAVRLMYSFGRDYQQSQLPELASLHEMYRKYRT